MIKMKTELIYKEFKHEIGTYNITPELFIEFCNNHNYTGIIVKYNEDGFYLVDDKRNLCILDFLGEYIQGNGIFSKYKNLDDNKELYNMIDTFLTNIENDMYDIVFVNDTSISIRRF